ncbi:NAD(P)-dependent oxidoreductase [Rhizobium rhizogenes]|uniref:NAD(P)-dependent oxidoreductase n=1 Tax=Rhizobium rhizogenes TaxID=359 RepID=UPI001573B261|nr:NAD(P)-dependent oxidoreductase [Rhizobium rhizogenes]NTI78472.1 D-3-phosphoglycerate dehydrogenase [Rhizobium rhizogenes]
MLVTFTAPAFLDPLFGPLLSALGEHGHDTRRFHDHADFLADARTCRETDVVIALPDLKAGSNLMEAAPKLRGLVSPVTGTEGFDEGAATDRGILVVNGQIEQNYKSMAEATVLLILAAMYDLKGTERILRENLPRPPHLKARMIARKTIGLIGFGQISQTVAERLSTWEANIITTVRTPRVLPSYVTAVDLGQLLRESDVVVVLTALNSESRGMLDESLLETMKQDVTFVNVARGGIVDDDALAALASRRPDMRLALDVFAPEPLRLDSPLRYLPDAILTPHMVGHTVETHAQLPLTLRDNVLDLLDGRVPAYVRNRGAVDAWLKRFGGKRN